MVVLFFCLMALGFGIFALPKRTRYAYVLTLLIASILVTTTAVLYPPSLLFLNSLNSLHSLNIPRPDALSVFFILVINFTALTSFLFSGGYLKAYYEKQTSLRWSVHLWAFLWLYFSMILVVILRDGFAFLVAWELMAVSSFLLVIFEADDRKVLKTGINYLIQMHVGLLFLLVAFLVAGNATGATGFDALREYFRTHSNILVFCLFFAGFGIKAGFIPLHTWLPEAHPAAPSPVSGLMSGVMIKMGIYGILRVVFALQSDLFVIGLIILGFSLFSGVMGVMMAIVQHDLKRLLAYHSIENIGIIGIGTGLGVLGLATGNHILALLGFSGGLLHVLNHSLFKSLLFFNAGSVYQATHTRNMDQLGGLAKKMPFTALFFLIGSLAICGLPPFNGFISEFLIYLGMFRSMHESSLYFSILLLVSLIGLTLIGGLAIFCFTKAFGIVFLGQPRSAHAENAHEVGKGMLLPSLLASAAILAIGLGSALFVRPVMNIVSGLAGLDVPEAFGAGLTSTLSRISLAAGVFIALVAILAAWRHFHLKNRIVESGPTWGCGYTAGDAKQQYTATSWADNFSSLANPVLGTQKEATPILESELFPDKKSFATHPRDLFKSKMIEEPLAGVMNLFKKIAFMQTGQIQHYILYAFLFMLLVMLLTIFKIL
jgi:formate hydrogenlyase subunit 3/multisubunit Na+/H+ antiporter MnhD subunit